MSFLLKVYLANLLYTCRGEEIDLEIHEKKNDELSVGLMAMVVEHCTVIAEVMHSVLLRPEFFQAFLFFFAAAN